jgi:hypothetical protein
MSGALERAATLSTLRRAAELLAATRAFLYKNPVMEYTVFYDETECDGACLADDCGFAIDEIAHTLAILTREG